MDHSGKDHPLQHFYRDIHRKYDLVNRVFTFGRDQRWRKKAVEACLKDSPHKVLDVCTGTGDLVLEIAAQADSDVQLYGYDFSSEMLRRAREKAGAAGAEIDFLQGDVADMPYADDLFDVAGITFGIRNLLYENSNASKHLAQLHRVIRTGGRLVILESSKPVNRVWRFMNGIYLQFILPYLGGALSGNIRAYRYLARSSRNYYTAGEMQQILEKTGFTVISSRALFLGSVMLMVAEKQGTINTVQ